MVEDISLDPLGTGENLGEVCRSFDRVYFFNRDALILESYA